MDNSLFSKFERQIRESKDKKDAIIEVIKESSGISISPEEITINKNTVTLLVSSAKRSRLAQANVRGKLEAIGYALAY